MYCIYCGTKLSDDSAFCNRCGKPQKNQSDAQQQTVISQEIINPVNYNVDDNDAQGQAELGKKYYFGKSGVKKDETKARECFEKAAAQGNAMGLWGLAVCNVNGEGGLAKNETKALELCDMAIQRGSLDGLRLKGSMYRDGRGVPQNDTMAVAWFRNAAEQGDARAQWFLGLMYRDGRGVPQNLNEALNWISRAAQLDDDFCIDYAELLEESFNRYFDGIRMRFEYYKKHRPSYEYTLLRYPGWAEFIKNHTSNALGSLMINLYSIFLVAEPCYFIIGENDEQSFHNGNSYTRFLGNYGTGYFALTNNSIILIGDVFLSNKYPYIKKSVGKGLLGMIARTHDSRKVINQSLEMQISYNQLREYYLNEYGELVINAGQKISISPLDRDIEKISYTRIQAIKNGCLNGLM